MGFLVLDDFEDGTIGDAYSGKSDGNWSVGQFSRANGFGPGRYAAIPFTGVTPDGYVVDTPIEAPGGDGSQALLFAGSSAWVLTANYEIGDGLGGHFYSRGWTDDLGFRLTIDWSKMADSRAGGMSVERYFDELHIAEWHSDDDTGYEENASTVGLTSFLPGNPPGAIGLWLDVQFHRGEGWSIADLFGGTLASGDYSWTIPSTGLEWDLNFYPNTFGPFAPSGSLVLMADRIYGWSGTPDGSAVRLYPRDDGRGMSSAPRRWPPPKSRRIIGGYP